jgi:hypothetical protein
MRARQRVAEALIAVGDVAAAEEALPPRVEALLPASLHVGVRRHRTVQESVHVHGNSTLRLLAVRLALPASVAGTTITPVQVRRGEWRIDVPLGPLYQPGEQQGELIVTSNAGDRGTLVFPVSVSVRPALEIVPPVVWLGPVTQGATSHTEVQIRAMEPCHVSLDHSSNANAPMSLDLRCERPDEYVLSATLSGQAEPGMTEGTIELSTDIEGETRIAVPYRVHVLTKPGK